MPEPDAIHIKGARTHNLNNLDLKLPRGRLTAITGVSGSGKSSLAFDTLYAEGYRQYMESLSVKARQLLAPVQRPDIDYIHGLSPVIAIEQHGGVSFQSRSTVATVSELSHYAALLWTACGVAHCPNDGALVERRSLDDVIAALLCQASGSRLILLAPLPSAKAAALPGILAHLRRRGFQRIRTDGVVKTLDEAARDVEQKAKAPLNEDNMHLLEWVVDRLVLDPKRRSRLADSLELAFREGKDRALALIQEKEGAPWREQPLSQNMSCSQCGAVYPPLTPRSFAYHSPQGACPQCGGLGSTMQFQESLIVPDPTKSVRQGAIKPWRSGPKRGVMRRNALLNQVAEQLPFDSEKPWQELDISVRRILLEGAGERLFTFRFGRSKAEQLPFHGVKADLEARFYKEATNEGFNARLASYQIRSICPSCQGTRLGAYSRAVEVEGISFTAFMSLTVTEALKWVRTLAELEPYIIVKDAIEGLERRLHFLNEVGLGYLTLDRTYATLSGGEAQRVRLATQLGLGFVGVVYVLDEPSIGLHPREQGRLLDTLCALRDQGNTVIVVEHDPETLRRADHLVELGPGAGVEGGRLLFEGSPAACCHCAHSAAGAYLSGRKRLRKNAATLAPGKQWLTIRAAAEHNLKGFDVTFPIGLLSVVCGVSGSGKSTLVNDILANTAALRLNGAKTTPGRHGGIEGLEAFDAVVRVDQSSIGSGPRSIPATYTKVFDLLRELFAQCPLAKARGYTAARFSFNTVGGRCERCKGGGQVALDRHFLSDVYIECPSCQGCRYNRETLEVRFKGQSIAEVLDMSIARAHAFFSRHPRIAAKLEILEAIGLGYVQLGQPAPTLSGGEAQRIKLALELSKHRKGRNLYILDEPTTGLHWDDIQQLLDLLLKLRDDGNTVVLIEHHLDVIDAADYLIELGPGGGPEGGSVVYAGPREGFEKQATAPTASYLR